MVRLEESHGATQQTRQKRGCIFYVSTGRKYGTMREMLGLSWGLCNGVSSGLRRTGEMLTFIQSDGLAELARYRDCMDSLERRRCIGSGDCRNLSIAGCAGAGDRIVSTSSGSWPCRCSNTRARGRGF